MRQILRYASRKGGRILDISARKDRVSTECDGMIVEARRNVQEVDNWTAVHQLVAKSLLKCSQDSEALKVSTRELQEQVLSPNESSVSMVRIARQARSENSKKMFQIFSRQGANEILVASMARGEEDLRMLVVLERDCLALREEVGHLNEKQGVLTVLMEGKMSMQKSRTSKVSGECF